MTVVVISLCVRPPYMRKGTKASALTVEEVHVGGLSDSALQNR